MKREGMLCLKTAHMSALKMWLPTSNFRWAYGRKYFQQIQCSRLIRRGGKTALHRSVFPGIQRHKKLEYTPTSHKDLNEAFPPLSVICPNELNRVDRLSHVCWLYRPITVSRACCKKLCSGFRIHQFSDKMWDHFRHNLDNQLPPVDSFYREPDSRSIGGNLRTNSFAPRIIHLNSLSLLGLGWIKQRFYVLYQGLVV